MRHRILLITDTLSESDWVHSIVLRNRKLQIVPTEYTAIDGEPLVFYSRDEGSIGLHSQDIALFVLNLSKKSEQNLQLLKTIKSEQSLKHLPVIIVAELDDSATLQKFFAAGASDLLHLSDRVKLELGPRIEATLKRDRNLHELRQGHTDLEQTARDLRTSNIIFRSISIHDDLTGVPNRRFFDRYLDISWRKSHKNAAPISLLMVDVDHFKKFNDIYGHQAGDTCLRQVAGALEACMDEESFVLARYGGEEFGAILPGADLNVASALAEKMRLAVLDLNLTHAGSEKYKQVTISQGLATAVPGLLMRPSQLIQKADRALYQAKAAGRNQTVC